MQSVRTTNNTTLRQNPRQGIGIAPMKCEHFNFRMPEGCPEENPDHIQQIDIQILTYLMKTTTATGSSFMSNPIVIDGASSVV
jgi:hypothetical protein